MFVDERNISVEAGFGGDGIVHWRKEKYIAKGGPDGGNGGRGGDVFAEGIRDIRALEKFFPNQLIKAEDGEKGKDKLKTGRNGKDKTMFVPVGSIIKNLTTNEVFEIINPKEKFLLASGGSGGYGNAHFKSSTNTTPYEFTKGEEPQKYDLNITLHIIGDVGLIGLPSAGKSTLLNHLTNSTAKVGAYPFTTLEPNLGVFNEYIIADIPGLIENASKGKGLGHKFLRHIQRTRVLVHLVSAEDDVEKSYKTIRKELGDYDKSLQEKKELVVLSKIDCVSQDELKDKLKKLPKGTMKLTVLDDKILKDFCDSLTKVLSSL